jgi:hypothetical protein
MLLVLVANLFQVKLLAQKRPESVPEVQAAKREERPKLSMEPFEDAKPFG